MRHWDSLTDAQRLWVLLRRAGSEGVHSHDIRSEGVSGNPSQRAKDVTSKGQQVFTAREPRGKRPGSRYWLAAHAPDFAVPVQPNGAEGGGDAADGKVPPSPPTATPLSAEQADQGADSGAVEKERPRLTLIANYWGDKPEWREEWA